MVTAYWNIGRLIVEDEQQGSTRAEYGKAVLANLSVRLTEEFGKGFTEANLRNMRQFYQCFPNCYALRSELTWTHYRLLIRVQDEDARQWYMNEAAEQTWSSFIRTFEVNLEGTCTRRDKYSSKLNCVEFLPHSV